MDQPTPRMRPGRRPRTVLELLDRAMEDDAKARRLILILCALFANVVAATVLLLVLTARVSFGAGSWLIPVGVLGSSAVAVRMRRPRVPHLPAARNGDAAPDQDCPH